MTFSINAAKYNLLLFLVRKTVLLVCIAKNMFIILKFIFAMNKQFIISGIIIDDHLNLNTFNILAFWLQMLGIKLSINIPKICIWVLKCLKWVTSEKKHVQMRSCQTHPFFLFWATLLFRGFFVSQFICLLLTVL